MTYVSWFDELTMTLLCYSPLMDSSDLLTRSVAKIIPADLAKEKIASGKKLRIYWGIDPTGGKIHLGHAIPLRKMRQFADAGHEVIMVIGSFTAMIGDPSDKDSMRKMLTKEDVERNFQTYKEQASKVLDFGKIQIRYNHEWLEKLTLKEVVQLASHFTVQQISERETFERRMQAGKPVALHEFFYPLMVGYDSVVLDVDCELGGTDQEFNMLAGRTLQKAFGKREKFIMTTKLIEGTDGRLMSKTYDNCVYLSDEPNDMYGKLMSLKDALMEVYFECCTDLPMKEVRTILKGNPRDAKARLAREIVTLYHGADSAAKASEEFDKVFKGGGVPDDIPEVTVKPGTLLIDVLVEHKLAPSKSEARRLIEQGGVKINEETVKSSDAKIQAGILRVGKRKFLSVILK